MASARTVEDLGAVIRAERRRRGWTQGDLATRAHTTRQWISQVERGRARAETGLLVAVLRALGLRLSIDADIDELGGRTWLTAADAGEAIREELARGDVDFALRMLARAVADLRTLRDGPDIAAFLAPPPSTGDHRWDTLLAAVVGRECRLRCVEAPAWTRVPPLRTWWFPAPDPILDARTMQRTPIDLSIKGIWLDANAWESL